MKDNVYVSTGAFRAKSLKTVLEIARSYGITNIELAPGLDYSIDTLDIIRSFCDEFNFLIHNYFPTPKESFGLNLASDNEETIMKSMQMCMANIDLASECGIPVYSVHCGFCFDTDGRHLGNPSQAELMRIPMETAKKRFVKNICSLCDYAKEKGVYIAIENNVMAEYVSKEKGMFLGVNTEDIKEILFMCNRDNLKVLLDLAHAKVSNTFLRFDVEKMINELKEHVIEVHVSDNDGLMDQNRMLRRGTDITQWIEKLNNRIITLEVYGLLPEDIVSQISLLEECV